MRIFVLEHTEAAAGEDLIRRVLAIAANAQMGSDTSHSFFIKEWATLVEETFGDQRWRLLTHR